jgi:hypothetical protein
MNCIIGLCKKNEHWPSTLANLGYKIQIIEQRIRNARGEVVKPDIILATNETPSHVLLVECKGGNSLDQTQIRRYSEVNTLSFKPFVTVRSDNLTFETSLADFSENHARLLRQNEGLPIITFEQRQISKTGTFQKRPLDQAFEKPITLEGMKPPIHYYPFSDDEDMRVVARYVLRALISLSSQPDTGRVTDEVVFTNDEMLTTVHMCWNDIADAHRTNLRNRIRQTVQYLFDSFPKLEEQLEELHSKSGVRVTGTLQSLQRTCMEIMSEIEKRTTMPEFPHE